MSHLDALENHSIFILREANHAFRNLAMPWSMGKDSNVLLWLSLKAFFGKVPYPLLHIDTTYEFPEMIEFREWATKHYGIKVIVKVNTEARDRGVGYETHDPVTVTHELKTVALKQAIVEHVHRGILREPGVRCVRLWRRPVSDRLAELQDGRVRQRADRRGICVRPARLRDHVDRHQRRRQHVGIFEVPGGAVERRTTQPAAPEADRHAPRAALREEPPRRRR